MCVRTETLQPEISLPRTTPILVSQLPLHQSLRLRHLHRRMVRLESQVHQHPKGSLEPQFFHPAIQRVMARGKARVVEDLDHLLPEIPPRPFVTFIPTREIASMVTNVNTVILNIIGTKGRTKVARARTVDRRHQEDHGHLVGRLRVAEG